MSTVIDQLLKWMPAGVQWRIRRWIHARRFDPRLGAVRIAGGRLAPVSRRCDERGLPIDRYYIERFIGKHASDIKGSVLEFADDGYTRLFGGERVDRSDVMDVSPENKRATIVADLSAELPVPDETYDCIICTQTLLCIYDVRSAVRNLYRMLKVHGVILATVGGISPVSRYDMDRWGDYWRFTDRSMDRLFREEFGPGPVTVESCGNVFCACSFLHNLAADEVPEAALDYNDPDYPISILVRAVKEQASSSPGE